MHVLYQDPWIIAINKPANLLSVPAKDTQRDNLYKSLIDRAYNAHIVHRLDEPTSGVILFALNKDTQKKLQLQFRQRTLKKSYIAVTNGIIQGNRGSIHLPLRRNWPERPRQIVCHAKGKWAQTVWHLLRHDITCSRLQLVPITGRTHQLRMHLAAIGHPIVGDPLYNPQPMLNRLLLHAHYLCFIHPYLHYPITIKAPLPF